MVHVPAPGVSPDETVVASVDATGPTEEFVIADISADDAWLSMTAESAPTLPFWR